MTDIIVPEEFRTIIQDFINDIKITFPEYNDIINKWWKDETSFDHITDVEYKKKAIINSRDIGIKFLFKFCQKKYPSHFFNILYQSDNLFDDENDVEFLPRIDFKQIWNSNINQQTKDTIWKYLQLILFSIIKTIDNADELGNISSFTDSINNNEFSDKISEILDQLSDKNNQNNQNNTDDNTDDNTDVNDNTNSNIPDSDDINNHMNKLFNGKLGLMAKELAAETVEELNIDTNDVTNMDDAFKQLMSDPTKFTNIVQKMGDKLDTKFKSGDLKESEIIEEASNLMQNMSNMGMGNIGDIMSKMGMKIPGGNNNSQLIQSQLKSQLKNAKIKEQFNQTMQSTQINNQHNILKQDHPQEQIQQLPQISEEEILKIFSTGETVEKTPRQQSQIKKNKKSKKTKK
jgi:hypothetical protein